MGLANTDALDEVGSVDDPQSDVEEIVNDASSSDVERGVGIAPGNSDGPIDRARPRPSSSNSLNYGDANSSRPSERRPVSYPVRDADVGLNIELSDDEPEEIPRSPDSLSGAEEGDGIDGEVGDNDNIGNAETGDNDAIGDGNVEGDEPAPVEPKKKRTKIRTNVLNLDKLKGLRGITALEDAFKNFKWKGRGHEVEDLNSMMHVYEHWAHRMFPRYNFMDCLQQINYLGRKREAYTLIKRYRLGMLNAEVPVQLFDDDDQQAMNVDNPEQPINVDNHDPPEDVFDALMNESDQQPQLTDDTPAPQVPTLVPAPPVPTLTAEQRERIERNRLAAQERRLAKLRNLVP